MKITAKIDTAQINKLFKQLQANGQDTSPATREITGMLLDSVEENFAAEGRPVKWQAWKASTRAQRKKRKTHNGKVLQERGQLAASIHGRSGKTFSAVGTNLEYARIHQLGGTINHPGGTPYYIGKDGLAVFMKKDGKYPPGTKFTKAHPIKIPARPYLNIQNEDIRDAERILTRHLMRGV